MKTPHKHAEAIKAWADGADIQWRGITSMKWSTTTVPEWDGGTEYRIKPADKFQVRAYKPVSGSDGWTENQRTSQMDPTANQYNLVPTDGVGNALFLFETYQDADDACRAINKSIFFA